MPSQSYKINWVLVKTLHAGILYGGQSSRASEPGCCVQLPIFERALLSLVMSEGFDNGVSETDYKKVKNSLNDLFRITARTALSLIHI